MDWANISYIKIIYIFVSEAITRLLWLLLIFLYVYFFTKYRSKTDSLLVPWSFKDAFNAMALLLVVQYGLFGFSKCFLKYLYHFDINITREANSLTNNITSMLKSLIFFLTPFYIIKQHYHSKISTLGFNNKCSQSSIRWGIFISVFYLYFIFLRLKGFWTRYPDQYIAQIDFSFDTSTILAFIIFAPIAEEVLFRGFLYQSIRRRLPFLQAALISSLCFTLSHMFIDKNSWIIFFQGYLLAYIFSRSGSILGCIILHISGNLLRLIADHENGIVVQIVSWNTLIFIGLAILIGSYIILGKTNLLFDEAEKGTG